jgi:integrase
MRGSVYKRCGCPVKRSPAGTRLACKKTHGSWFYVADAGVHPASGKRRQLKRGGYPTKAEAEDALAELVDSAQKGTLAHDEKQTVAMFLEAWIVEKARIGTLRPTTVRSYRQHVDTYIVPAIGRMRLRDVRPDDVDSVLRTVTAKPATVRRVHATIRSAFGTAKRRRLIAFNPAVDVELPSASRPKVTPWEPAELGAFLDHVAADEYGPLFELIAQTGLRRGEAVGLRWNDVDLEARRLTVRQQIVGLYGDQATPCPYCGKPHAGATFGRPKTANGENRVVDLDGGVVGVLLAQRLHQDAKRAEWGNAYSDHGLVFARADGTPIPSERVTKRFSELAAEAGLRHVRLHDLRHGQASLMLAAGVSMPVISKRLGHSTLSLTSDTYSHLLEGVGRDAAERASALIPRASKAAQDEPCDQSVTNSPEIDANHKPSEAEGQRSPDKMSGPRRARTDDLRIKRTAVCRSVQFQRDGNRGLPGLWAPFKHVVRDGTATKTATATEPTLARFQQRVVVFTSWEWHHEIPTFATSFDEALQLLPR